MEESDGAGIVIIKVGTSTIIKDGKLNEAVMEALADDVAQLWKQGRKVVIVTSGARMLGMEGIDNPNTATAVGQGELIEYYKDLFRPKGIKIGQLLVESTHFDVDSDNQQTGVIHALEGGLRNNVLMVVNENDPLATPETTMGNNDPLTAKIAIGLKEKGHNVELVVFMSVKDTGPGEISMGKGGAQAKAVAMTDMDVHGIVSVVVQGRENHVVLALFQPDMEVFKSAFRAAHEIRQKHLACAF